MTSQLPIHSNRLCVRVKPNSSQTQVTKIDGNIVHICVAAAPQENKANKELLKFLKKETGRTCRIFLGMSSRTKIVEFL